MGKTTAGACKGTLSTKLNFFEERSEISKEFHEGQLKTHTFKNRNALPINLEHSIVEHGGFSSASLANNQIIFSFVRSVDYCVYLWLFLSGHPVLWRVVTQGLVGIFVSGNHSQLQSTIVSAVLNRRFEIHGCLVIQILIELVDEMKSHTTGSCWTPGLKAFSIFCKTRYL